MNFALEAHHLRKQFGQTVALEDLTLEVPRGEVFGFLGPNGAGKTTAVKLLTGLARPTSGSGHLLERPLGNREARRKLGFLPELFRFHDWLTAEEVLGLHGELSGMSSAERRARIPNVLDLVGLNNRSRDRVGTFSKGMQQRLGLAVALVHEPEVVILDEPTSALDPVGRRDIRLLIQQLKTDGVTVFLNSHLLSEIELVCDRVAIVDHGRVVREGRLDELLALGHEIEIRGAGLTDGVLAALPDRWAVRERGGDRLVLAVPKPDDAAEVTRFLVAHEVDVLELRPLRANLEDLFLKWVDGGQAVPANLAPLVESDRAVAAEVSLMPIWTLTRLTLREASRSKLLLIALLLTLIYIGLVAFGVRTLADHAANSLESLSSGAGLELVAFFFGSFMLALLAVFVAGHSTKQEADTGLLLAILSKPVRRFDVLAGRWLGSAVLLLGWVALFTAGVVSAVDWGIGFVPPAPAQAGALMLLEALVVLTLRLLFGTFLGTLASGIVPLLLWGLARIGGLVETIGHALGITTMVNAGIVTSLFIPTDVLSRGASYFLLPEIISLGGEDLAASAARGNPFAALAPIAGPMVVWAALYVLALFAISARIFSRRDV